MQCYFDAKYNKNASTTGAYPGGPKWPDTNRPDPPPPLGLPHPLGSWDRPPLGPPPLGLAPHWVRPPLGPPPFGPPPLIGPPLWARRTPLGTPPLDPPPLEIEKQNKKVIRANFKLFHLYFATFLVGSIIFSAIF